ncbi:MAG: hypothetical protein KC586_02140, partial [Myxococcales bacterium]|nr:hypothetical protein [Myxococcales bacterium]
MASQDHPARAHRLARSYALLAGTPAVFLLGGALPAGDEPFELPVRVGAACLFALGAWILPTRWTRGAALITFALLATVGAHALALRTRPDLVVFALAVAVTVMLTTLTAPTGIGRKPPDWRPPVVHTLALSSLAG